MKKKIFALAISLTLILAIFLSGCINQNMADEINEKAKNSGYTYTQLIDDYGTPTIDRTAGKELGIIIGYVVYVKNCDNYNEYSKETKKGKKFSAVKVDVLNGKIEKATYYKEYTLDK